MSELSIVVVAYSMAREVQRTLRTLEPGYQRNVADIDYEVVVVDNGSPDPLLLPPDSDRQRLHRIAPAPASPAHAANTGVALSSGRYLGLVLDGARMVTPGVVSLAMRALLLHPKAIVTTLAWHLGPDHQSRSVADGYDAAAEEELLRGISWPADGYRLFEISALAGANPGGFFGPINESCCLFLRRELWEAVGGLDERFDMAGGGFVNLDLFSRLIEEPNAQLIILLGEGSFHQVHGGISSGPAADFEGWRAQYEAIRTRPYVLPSVEPLYFGRMPENARNWIMSAPEAEAPRRRGTIQRAFGMLRARHSEERPQSR